MYKPPLNTVQIITTSFPSNTTVILFTSVSAVTRTKSSTPDTNSLLPDSQRLVILFHIRNVKTLWANFSPHIYHKPLAGLHCLFLPVWTIFSPVLYISSQHSRSQIEAGNWERKAERERGENEKPLTAGPPAYFLLLNRFRLTRCRKYSPLHLLPTQLIRPEDPHRPSNPQ